MLTLLSRGCYVPHYRHTGSLKLPGFRRDNFACKNNGMRFEPIVFHKTLRRTCK